MKELLKYSRTACFFLLAAISCSSTAQSFDGTWLKCVVELNKKVSGYDVDAEEPNNKEYWNRVDYNEVKPWSKILIIDSADEKVYAYDEVNRRIYNISHDWSWSEHEISNYEYFGDEIGVKSHISRDTLEYWGWGQYEIDHKHYIWNNKGKCEIIAPLPVAQKQF